MKVEVNSRDEKKPATGGLQALIFAGAEEKTRTSTGEPPLDPEPSASTNSATSATGLNMILATNFVKTFLVTG